MASIPAPAPCPLSASSLSFLSNYARTQRFRVGQPGSCSVDAKGDVFFLRTEDASKAPQNLYHIDASTGVERVLVRAEDLLPDGDETMSEEERKLRERKRLTSKGLLSFQLSGARPGEVLIPYQAHLYLVHVATRQVTNVTANSPYESHGAPSYPQLSPDGQKIALVRNGDIFIIDLSRGALPAAAPTPVPAVAGESTLVSGSSGAGAAAGAVASAAASHFDEWRLTFDGPSCNEHVQNGVADFIAQEELGRFRGLWFSPDSSLLLFQQTDSSALEQLSILDLQNPSAPPTKNAYPRPGKANATTKLGLLAVARPTQTFTEAPSAAAAAAAKEEPASKKRKRAPSKKKSGGAAAAAAPDNEDDDDARAPTPISDPPPSPVWLKWSADEFPYIATVSWSVAGAPLTLVLQNRLQSVSSVLLVEDLSTGATREILREEQPKGWVNIDHSAPHWLKDGRHFLWSSEQHSGGEWLTLQLHDRAGKRVRALHSPEQLQYRKLLHVDETCGVAYVLGGPDATEQHVWRVPLGLSLCDPAASPSAQPRRLTTIPAIHNAVFSSGDSSEAYVLESHSLKAGSRFTVRRLPSNDDSAAMQTDSANGSSGGSADDDSAHSGAIIATIRNVSASVPVEHLPRVELLKVEASEQLAWEELQRSNALIEHDQRSNPLTVALRDIVPKRKTLLDYSSSASSSPPASFATLTYNVAILRPHGSAPGARFPVVVYVYGGPGHRLVTQDRSTYYIAQFVANQGFIVVVTDNRGTPFRGASWEKAIFHHFHEKPLIDQVSVVRALAAQDATLDLSGGVGMFGWSFGGYMSALAGMRYPSLFAATFVGAPVCDWRDYDTAYTERVLGLPLENEALYDASSVLTFAPHLLRPLLLVHGSADDNVYFAHALQMSAALFQAGRAHEFLPLSGTHMLADPAVTVALYARLALFMLAHVAGKV